MPKDFRFSVKLPRSITHDARLRGCGPALDRFLDEIAGLGTRLGAVLVQLPPSLVFDARTVSTFLGMLRRRHAGPVAIEPRHRSWFDAADPLLHRHDVARVAADPAPAPGAATPAGSRHWQYWRWHGSPRIYYSAYDDAVLQGFASAQRDAPRAGTSYCIFDNTAHGHAIDDALRFKAMLAAAAAPARAGRARRG